MATSRPFAYNPTLITSGVTEQYGTLSVGFQDQPYGESPSGLKWWEGPDEDLGYCIGTSLPTGGVLAPDGIYGDVTFWRTQTFSDSQFIILANKITKQNFTSSLEAVTWLNANGYWTSYAGVPATTPTSTPTPTNTQTPTNTPTPTAGPVSGAWSASGSLITGREDLGGAGIQTAGLAFGGTVGYNNPVLCTEEYNGLSWSTGGSLINARYDLAGAGTQNAGLAFGGEGEYLTSLGSCTEEYDGSSWSSGGSLITSLRELAGAGTQDAGLAFGGIASPFIRSSCTEEYNGSSWSVGGTMICARDRLAGAGTQNAGLAFGGVAVSQVSCTEEYNGTSWSSGGALITTRYWLAGAGTQDAGLAFGGITSPFVILSCTEEYDGSSWSSGGALITARFCLAGSGTQSAGLAFGGSTPTGSCTEEYNSSPSITPTPTETTTQSTPTPTSTIALTPTNTATPTPTTYPTIYTHGAVRATCSDFCTTNYNITTVTSSSDSYAGLAVGDFIYGISGAGFIAYSNVSTDTTTGPFRIAEIDSNGEVLSILVCNGVTCEPL
jgi:hypothetical protein